MKKIFLFAAAVVAALTVNAADKSWNFTTLFPDAESIAAVQFTIGDGQTPNALVDGELYVYGNGKDKAWAMDPLQSAKYFVDFLTQEESIPQETSEGINYKQTRLKSGGAGSVAEGKIKGAIAFCVAGNSTVTVAAVSSSGSAVRKLQLLDANGTEVGYALFDGNVGKLDGNKKIKDDPFVFNYVGGATTLYLVSAMQVTDAATDGYTAGGINFYKVAATNVAPWAPQGINHVNASAKTVKRVVDGQVVIERDGRMFNLLGAEVK